MMFCRKDETYVVGDEVLDRILADDANPLCQISKLIGGFNGQAKVLDMGAGNGLLARVVVRETKNVIIDGIEPSKFASTIASAHYRKFYTGFGQDFFSMIEQENYNFIVLADVIEHMVDPFTFLKELCKQVSLSTKIVITTPNVAFGAVRIALLNGHFNYVDSGILEKTHLRFFTLETLLSMFSNIEIYIEKIYFLNRSFFNSEIDIIKYRIGISDLLMLSNDELASTYQFLFVLTKSEVLTETIKFGMPIKLSILQYLLIRLKYFKLISLLSRIYYWLKRKI